MKQILAVAVRELRERWLLFPGAFVAGFFPLVIPAFGVTREAAPTAGAAGAILLGAAAAVVMGSSMLARDTADGRLRFLFSRPLPWGAIWLGKWLAAMVLVVSSVVLISIPWMTAIPLSSLGGRHGDSWLRAILGSPGALPLALAGIVIIVGLSNFGATALRSRSTWVVVDLALLLLTFWATRRYFAPLWQYGIVPEARYGIIVVGLLPLALAGIVGSLAQVSYGRTDLRRAHRALSLGFWAVIGLTLAVAAGYWAWVRSAGPDGVIVQRASCDPAGRWLYVEGTGRHSGIYPLEFLIDTTTGRYLARPGPDEDLERLFFGPMFSGDGRVAALAGAATGGAALKLFDLGDASPRVTIVALESSAPPTGNTLFALSPKAATVFVANESGASLFALPSGRRVATTTTPPGWRPGAVSFPAEGSARAWLVPNDGRGARQARAEMRVVDLAAGADATSVTFPLAAAVDPLVRSRLVLPDATGQRILTWDAGLRLRDGATGHEVASLVEGSGSVAALFLADGRIVVERRADAAEPAPAHARLRVFDPAGTLIAEMELPLPSCPLGLGPEVGPGRVAVSCVYGSQLARDTVVVDVASGAVVERLEALRPALRYPGAWQVAGSTSSVHFFSTEDARFVHEPDRAQVVRVDFATGERRVVAGAGAARGERISAR